MPIVKGPTYHDKGRNKIVRRPTGRNYYDTNEGKWYKTQWAYRDKQAYKTEGRSAYQKQERRKRLRAKGKTPRTITKPRRRRQQYDIFDGYNKDRMLRRCSASRGKSGYVQAFIPGEYDHGQGGSSSVGKNERGEEIQGFWVTRGLDDLSTIGLLMNDDRTERWVDEVDPFGVGVVWRVLRSI